MFLEGEHLVLACFAVSRTDHWLSISRPDRCADCTMFFW
uniref:Uncharacterized protein n=1 Tax=Triticum urartu TaxID=4572 RepID=A0A8R7THB2_TRIUA